jgi:hypothetical protein
MQYLPLYIEIYARHLMLDRTMQAKARIYFVDKRLMKGDHNYG